MKSFQQFITEADELKDKEGTGHGTGTTHRGGDKIGADRKKQEKSLPSPHSKGDKPKARVKAIGGGKTAPAKDYKQRKDVGSQRPKGRSTARQQQPEKERGSAALSPKEAQRKAYKERKAREAGAKTKTASELLSKKTTKTDPNYKPRKASGLTTQERKALYKKGERALRDIRLKNLGKTKESELKHRVTSK